MSAEKQKSYVDGYKKGIEHVADLLDERATSYVCEAGRLRQMMGNHEAVREMRLRAEVWRAASKLVRRQLPLEVPSTGQEVPRAEP